MNWSLILYWPGELLGFDGLSLQIHNCTAIALETVNYCHLPVHKNRTVGRQYARLKSGIAAKIL